MSSGLKGAAAAGDGDVCDSEDDESYVPSECSSKGDSEHGQCDGEHEPTGSAQAEHSDAHKTTAVDTATTADHAGPDVDAMWAEFLSDVGDGGAKSPADRAAAAAGSHSAQIDNDNTVGKQVEQQSARQGSTDNTSRKRKGGFESINLKKGKTSTLAASRHNWDSFKTEAGLHDELQTYNRGTGGYLSRRDFLQRADERRFESEKSVRDTARRRRT